MLPSMSKVCMLGYVTSVARQALYIPSGVLLMNSVTFSFVHHASKNFPNLNLAQSN